MKVISGLFNLLFGCCHRKLSFPFTMKPGLSLSAAGRKTGTYVVCLNCGKEFPYDWQQMRILNPSEEAASTQRALKIESRRAA